MLYDEVSVHSVMRHYTGITGIKLMTHECKDNFKESSCN